MKELLQQMGRYWICNECASRRDLRPFKTGNTLSHGICGWCSNPEEIILTPLRDLRLYGKFRGDIILMDDVWDGMLFLHRERDEIGVLRLRKGLLCDLDWELEFRHSVMPNEFNEHFWDVLKDEYDYIGDF